MVLRPIGGVPIGNMNRLLINLPASHSIAAQFVGHDITRHASMTA